ncbi:MAG: hypothetical protein AAFO86_14610, partial [Pseudomonadota bacterium]
MKNFVFAVVLAGVMATAAGAQDRQADVAAAAILTGFVNGDVAEIQRHTGPVNALRLQAILDGDLSPDTLLGTEAAQAAAQSDGQILPVRYERLLAFAPFAVSGPNGPAPLDTATNDAIYFVLRLSRETETAPWSYQGVGRMPRTSYENRAA